MCYIYVRVGKEEPPRHGACDKATGHFIDSDMAQSISGWSADEQAAYVASHMDQFDIAAKKGDIEREQTEYEDLP